MIDRDRLLVELLRIANQGVSIREDFGYKEAYDATQRCIISITNSLLHNKYDIKDNVAEGKQDE